MKRLFFIIIVALIPLLYSCLNEEIQKNKGLTIGKIIQNLNCAKGGYVLKYQYIVNDSIYFNSISHTIYRCKFEDSFSDKYFPVVYSTINPEKGLILLTPEDFRRWGYEFPDSLNWVKECLK